MAATIALTAIFEPVKHGWTQARVAEMPGVITAASTDAEARELLLDAVREYLLALQQDVEPVADDRDTRERIDIVIHAA